MQVNVKNGVPVVKLTKLEQKQLLAAASLLNTLETFAECQQSKDAAENLQAVIIKYKPCVE